MGLYINHPTTTKDRWLIKHGELLAQSEVISSGWKTFKPNDTVLVCLVDNGMFTAALVVANEGDYRDVTANHETRRRWWYLVNVADIADISPEMKGLLVEYGLIQGD